MTTAEKTYAEEAVQPFYNKPHRHYHNWAHIQAVFHDLAPRFFVEDEVPHDELYLAVLFHDVIYDPLATDNEEQSADFFQRFYLDHHPHLAPVDVSRVRELILATKQHDFVAGDEERNALIKADLGVLFAEPFLFGEYERQIRAEYVFVPRHIYLAERSRLMSAFKDKLVSSKKYLTAKEIKQLKANVDGLLQNFAKEARAAAV